MMIFTSITIGGKWIWRELDMNNRGRTWIRKWNPVWNIRLGLEQSSMNVDRLCKTLTVRDLSRTILNGLCSFMLEEWKSPIGYSGSIQADSITRKKLAKESGLYNLEKYPIFMELFPGN